ncbi:MAG: hypothetical protein IPJ82_23075 [Lewinellaceae bacterium]|nr:hypothetical protein [Lewinellaceae bacterium]
MSYFNAGKEIDSTITTSLLDTPDKFRRVLVSFHGTRKGAVDNFGLTDSQINLVRRLNDVTTVAVTMFGSPYSRNSSLMIVPCFCRHTRKTQYAQELAAQALSGPAI